MDDESPILYGDRSGASVRRLDWSALARRRGKLAVIVFLTILVLGVVISLSLPAVYRASAIILIEQQEIPSDLVRSTITGFADQRVQVIRQRVMTSTNLIEIINKYDLYVEERSREPVTVVLGNFRDDIQLNMISADVVDPRSGRPTQATIAFSLSYRSRSPTLAQQVTNELVSLFLAENLQERTQRATETYSFLTEEANRLNREISALEQQLADFKARNGRSLPELQQLNLQLLDRADRELMDIDRSLQALEEQRIALEGQLSIVPPYDRLISETGERLLGPADRLKASEAQLVAAQARYTEDHPEVRTLKREVARLRAELGYAQPADELLERLEDAEGRLADLRGKYAEDHPDIVRLENLVSAINANLNSASTSPDPLETPEPASIEADNPTYIDLRTRLDAVIAEQRAMGERRRQAERKFSDYESVLINAPLVEAEYRKLSRDYQNALLKYQEIKDKEMEAQLAESLETDRKGERFTLIEPPLRPEEPISPNRPALLLLGVVLALGGGLGSVALAEQLDPTLRGPAMLSTLLGEAPLTVVPTISTQRELALHKRHRHIALVTAAVAVVVILVLIHFLLVPLDVAWFMLWRRLGL
ncbi:MAG: lipopolysaccharide biosynthesis protein [Pseudomonadota bacterium]|nr:lipopolysaccharide biosynthesis protein [Pseudomonadota bacterium]